MKDKNNVEIVSPIEYHLYNLVIERLSKVLPELRYAIKNCKYLEGNGFEMNSYMLQDAMTEIASVFAEAVAGKKYIKPSESGVK